MDRHGCTHDFGACGTTFLERFGDVCKRWAWSCGRLPGPGYGSARRRRSESVGVRLYVLDMAVEQVVPSIWRDCPSSRLAAMLAGWTWPGTNDDIVDVPLAQSRQLAHEQVLDAGRAGRGGLPAPVRRPRAAPPRRDPTRSTPPTRSGRAGSDPAGRRGRNRPGCRTVHDLPPGLDRPDQGRIDRGKATVFSPPTWPASRLAAGTGLHRGPATRTTADHRPDRRADQTPGS
ncbi:hypothetical protein HBB16_18770 [Pseudonocardia sp. MCCB 268]|nr:hypothetical protein [Pseudonocardia cytotoxica]